MVFTVLAAEWCHETNTFSVLPTTIENFHAQYYYDTPEEIHKQRIGTKSTIGATYEAAEKYQWDLTNSICASANPAGTVTASAFETMAGQILALCQPPHRYDGILLHLHGAMVAEGFEDAEGELLQRIRKIVGMEVPIIVTLDLHGNITELMAEMTSALLAVRTYPHIDFYETALRAADLLQDCMVGKVRPVTVIGKRPMLMGLDGGKTHAGSPMTDLIARVQVMEEAGDIVLGSICAGFTAADIYWIGPSVTVTVDVSNPKHRSSSPSSSDEVQAAKDYARGIADRCMDFVWETRHYKSENHHTVETAVTYAQDYVSKYNTINKPLVVADITDNPGSGHYGDATNLLRGMVEADLSDVIFYAIFDASAVLEGGVRIGVGNTGTISLGGRFDPSNGGAPLQLTGKVVAITDGCFPTYGPMGFGGCWQNFGLSMMFRVGRNLDIIVISNNGQLLDIAQITSLGCDPVYKKVIAVKSKQHFRAALTPIAGEIITVDGGGLGSVILTRGEYKNVRRPIWPLDEMLDC
eukprot:gene10911-11891_t